MNTKASPALVAREAALELPRYALFAFCAAYVLPGLFGRDPWRGEDLAAFGQMLAIAEGRTSWFAPALGGVPADGALLPHWIGAASILLNGRWLDPALAARLPFVLLLVATLAAIWYATFHLARTDAAQPVRFAFGGEAGPVDYARAVADGALLAAIATIGLLQLGHETTPELAQLAAVAAFQWALAASERRPLAARWTVLLALPCLAASGAPTISLLLGLLAVPWAMRDGADGARRLWPWLVGATLLGAIVATLLDAWAWRATLRLGPQQIIRLWLWFLWPSWLLAGWTLWRWRQHLGQRHLAVPLLSLAIALAASIVTGGSIGGSDRALMLGIPGIAVLAAFALPTLRRSASAAIDWFSVFFFTACALVIWVMYVAMQTGVPAKPAANIAKLAPGFEARLSIVEIVFATLGTLAWLWLVRWRTSHHRAALWKSLVLPAGGVALCWLLLMTLWLPLLDYARSYRALIDQLERVVPAGECIAAPDATPSLVAALEYHAKRAVDASPAAARGRCDILVVERPGTVRPLPPPGWKELAVARRPTERHELTLVYRRTAR